MFVCVGVCGCVCVLERERERYLDLGQRKVEMVAQRKVWKTHQPNKR